MKAAWEGFETARARTAHGVGNDPLLEIGRARFLGSDRKSHKVPFPLGPCTDSRWSNYFARRVDSLRQGNVSDRSEKPERKRRRRRF